MDACPLYFSHPDLCATMYRILSQGESIIVHSTPGQGGLLKDVNRSSIAPADRKRRQKGGPSTDQEDLWVRFLVAAGSSHTKDIKNGSGPSLHGTHDEVGTTKHNWLARC